MPGNNAGAAFRVGIARPAVPFVGKTRIEFEYETMVPLAIVALFQAPGTSG